MSPTTADFSQILELQQYRKLYEEQEENNKVRISEKDAQIESLDGLVADRDRQLQQIEARLVESESQLEKIRSEHLRLRQEAQEKIDKLGERIKELNQRLMGAR